MALSLNYRIQKSNLIKSIIWEGMCFPLSLTVNVLKFKVLVSGGVLYSIKGVN
jgi:hypothetical protein